ncbi:hypothetical protein [Paraburkholderia sabiae]|uniref:Uncharacterized protein n=1 Tax=Paraburkholderia sabiae TaxID=273251 RepID=A0ABU9QSG8_9BURK
MADKPIMHKQYIQSVVETARETADSIVGARVWATIEDADAMHDVIFWDMIARRLPDVTMASVLSFLDDSNHVPKKPCQAG